MFLQAADYFQLMFTLELINGNAEETVERGDWPAYSSKASNCASVMSKRRGNRNHWTPACTWILLASTQEPQSWRSDSNGGWRQGFTIVSVAGSASVTFCAGRGGE